MNNTFEKTKAVLLAILLITFGFVFIFVPETSYSVVSVILAWTMVVIGAFIIIFYLFNFRNFGSLQTFIDGLLFLGLGLLLMFVPYYDIAIIGLGLGIAGISFIGTSLDRKSNGYAHWLRVLVYGVIELAIGAVLVALHYSGATDGAVTIYLGVALIVDAIFVLTTISFIEREEE